MRDTGIIDSLWRKYPSAVPCWVVGNSMEPTILDDDGVLIDAAATSPRNGQIVCAIVAVDGGFVGPGRLVEAFVGRFRQSDNGAWLDKDNPNFPAMFLGRPERYRIQGTYRAIFSRFERPEEV